MCVCGGGAGLEYLTLNFDMYLMCETILSALTSFVLWHLKTSSVLLVCIRSTVCIQNAVTALSGTVIPSSVSQ